jgi:aminoglycoside phosphotransferase (APT) family kinase protein
MRVADSLSQEIPQWIGDLLDAASIPPARAATRLQGRNESYRVDTAAGAVVVKRLTGHGAPQRWENSRRFAAQSFDVPAPRLMYAAESSAALIFPEVADSIAGNELLVHERFTPALCAQVGRVLADLHGRACPPSPVGGGVDPLPTARALRGLPLEAVQRFTAGEVEAWRLIQGDEALVESVIALRERTSAASRTWIHGDFRVDQVLVVGDGVSIVDWEEFGVGDPAYDTGSWLGEWVYRAALDIPTARGDGVGTGDAHAGLAHRALSADQVVRRGVAKLDALTPHMAAFWDSYRGAREVSAEERTRVVQFAGWHLVERLLTLAQVKAMLPGVTRAAAGIGKRLLTDPGAAAQALGLTSLPTVTGAVA